MNKNSKEISNLIRARYPLVWVTSYEEGRVLDALKVVAAERKLTVKVWSMSQGWGGDDKAAAGNPQLALKAIDQGEQEGRSLFVYKDFHHFLGDAMVCRLVRDLTDKLPKFQSTAVFLSPVQKLNPDLEKSFHVMEWDLPGREEIAAAAEQILAIKGVVRPESVDQAVDSALGLTLTEVNTTFAKSAVTHKTLDVKAIIGEKKQILKKGGILEYFEAEEDISGVGGHEVLKDWLLKRKRAFGPAAREYGIPLPKGMLLVGPPGSGKSLVAKITGNLWGMPTLRLDVGRVFAGIVGSSEENMRKVIQQAEACAPCILWIDEMEKGFSGTGGGGDSGTSSRVFGTFLTWMQEHTSAVFVLATANDVSALPPELLRKGRFDEIWFSDLPSEQERADIFAIHLKKKGRDPDKFTLAALAQDSAGFTGAEIEQAVISAMYNAFDEEREVNSRDVLLATTETIPLSKTAKEKVEAVRLWAKGRARQTSKTKIEVVNAKDLDLS